MSSKVISTILKHDKKQNSYKIALVRAINDVVLSFPDLRNCEQDVAVPLRMLAEFWVAYYWCFSDSATPIIQGQRQIRAGQTRNDVAFRPNLSAFRQQWEDYHGGLSRPADGFLVIHDLRIPRKRETYPSALQSIYRETIATICRSLEQPIQYAGADNWSVFEKPSAYAKLSDRAVAVPGTQLQDKCLVITAELWQTFCEMSLWVEALCIHEWCLFTEKVSQIQTEINRGNVYVLLTARPDRRRPLTWESNQVDLLLMEGHEFICPWTEKRITQGIEYDLDHLLPVSIYPINELWNLLPSDPSFNRNTKRDRLPSSSRLERARHLFSLGYERYSLSRSLARALTEDVNLRFSAFRLSHLETFPDRVACSVVDLIEQISESRNLERF